MTLGTSHATSLLRLTLTATPYAGVADNAASLPLTALYAALHATLPSIGGSQTSGEVTGLTGYARKAIPRSTAGFTVTDGVASLVSDQDFDEITDGSAVAYFFSLGTAASGAGEVWHIGVLGTVLGFGVAATSDVITIPGLSGLAVDDRVTFLGAPGATVPAGLTTGTVYWVRSVSGNDITVSTTQGGAAVDVTGAGAFVAYRLTGRGATAGLVITPNTVPRLKAGSTITQG